MSLTSPVCRTCLGIISEGKVGYNIDQENGLIKNVRNIREMLMFCVPEMDIYISVNPSICDGCLPILVNLYNFKIRCMRVESAIRSYIIANNVMEGSCVDLSNVVRQQILDALKQKGWPHDVIQDYIAKVDKCLESSKKRPNMSEELFNIMSQNFSRSNALGRSGSPNLIPPSTAQSHANVFPIPNVAPRIVANIFPNIPDNNPELPNATTHVHLREPIPPNPPCQSTSHPTKSFVTVSRNLMPVTPEPFSLRQQVGPVNAIHTTQMTPDLTRKGPPNLPTARSSLTKGPFPSLPTAPSSLTQGPFPSLPTAPSSFTKDLFQDAFLNTFNLISSSSLGREEAVFVSHRAKRQRVQAASQPKRLPEPHRVKPCGTDRNPANASNIDKRDDNVVLDPKTGVLRKVKAHEVKQAEPKAIRKYLGPKSKGKHKHVTEKGSITVLADKESAIPKKNTGEVLIMNFQEDENVVQQDSELTLERLLKSPGPDRDSELTLEMLLKSPGVPVPQTKASTCPKKVVVRLPPIDKETMKRKLKPEDVIDEIESKRRRLTVKLNPNLPYLHTKKRLVVKVQKSVFLKCTFCKFMTIHPKKLANHCRDYHKACKICNFKCDKKPALDQHIDRCHADDLNKALKALEGDGFQFDCHLCNFIGLSFFDLRDHRIRIHIKCDMTGMYKCPYASCLAEDAIAYNIARHVDTKHDSVRRRTCPMCDYMPSSLPCLKKHVQSHSISTKMVCSLCGLSFKTTFSLERHREKKHANAKRQDNNVAGMAYAPTRGDLQTLTTDEEGRITLNRPVGSMTQSSVPAPARNVRGSCSFDQPSLSEMLCNQGFNEVTEQEDDCAIVDETPQKTKKHPSRRKTVILNRHNKKTQKTVDFDSPDDCIIISEDVETVDLSVGDSGSQKANKKRKIDTTESDNDSEVIEIIDDDCIPGGALIMEDVPVQSGTSESDTRLEVSQAQDLSPQNTVSGTGTEVGPEPSVSDMVEKSQSKQPAEKDINNEKEIHNSIDSGTATEISSEPSVSGVVEESQSKQGAEKDINNSIVSGTGSEICSDPSLSGLDAESHNKQCAEKGISNKKDIHNATKVAAAGSSELSVETSPSENDEPENNSTPLESDNAQLKQTISETVEIPQLSREEEDILAVNELISFEDQSDNMPRDMFAAKCSEKCDNSKVSDAGKGSESTAFVCSEPVLIESSNEDSNGPATLQQPTGEKLRQLLLSEDSNRNKISCSKIIDTDQRKTYLEDNINETGARAEENRGSLPFEKSGEPAILSDKEPTQITTNEPEECQINNYEIIDAQTPDGIILSDIEPEHSTFTPKDDKVQETSASADILSNDSVMEKDIIDSTIISISENVDCAAEVGKDNQEENASINSGKNEDNIDSESSNLRSPSKVREPKENSESTPIIGSSISSSLIESTDEDTSNCTLLKRTAVDDILTSEAGAEIAESTKIGADKPQNDLENNINEVCSRDEENQGSHPNEELSGTAAVSNKETTLDINQDSGDNIIISDPEPENSRVIEKTLDAELSEVVPDISGDKVADVLNTDTEKEGDHIEDTRAIASPLSNRLCSAPEQNKEDVSLEFLDSICLEDEKLEELVPEDKVTNSEADSNNIDATSVNSTFVRKDNKLGYERDQLTENTDQVAEVTKQQSEIEEILSESKLNVNSESQSLNLDANVQVNKTATAENLLEIQINEKLQNSLPENLPPNLNTELGVISKNIPQ